MRDKYIELIKEYIKTKPEYLSNLDEIKKDVLNIGATEEEFNEAIKQATAQSKELTKYPKAINLALSTKIHLGARKKYVAGIAFGVIILLFVTRLI